MIILMQYRHRSSSSSGDNSEIKTIKEDHELAFHQVDLQKKGLANIYINIAFEFEHPMEICASLCFFPRLPSRGRCRFDATQAIANVKERVYLATMNISNQYDWDKAGRYFQTCKEFIMCVSGGT